MGRAYWLEQNRLTEGPLERFFPFFQQGRHRIAIVGAGGKTTLLYTLAELFQRRGERTAVTTTTHIQIPEHCPYYEDPVFCEERWKKGEYAVLGREAGRGKLCGLEPAAFSRLCAEADQVLVEADGARHMACKVPASWEPVIPPQADIVIGVAGLSALGKRVEDACFRAAEAEELLACGGSHILDADDLRRILESEQGVRKGVGSRQYFVVLNQCDDSRQRALGEKILRGLDCPGVMTFFPEEERFSSARKRT